MAYSLIWSPTARFDLRVQSLWMRMVLTVPGVLLLAAGTVLAQGSPTIDSCPIFPADNIWNTPVDNLPVDARSSDYIDTIGRYVGMHADFGSGLWDGGPIGIPYNIVRGTQARVAVTFDYADESDPGPYPIPSGYLREWGSDHHILIVDRDNAVLYELYAAELLADGSWHAGSGAIFNLRSNALRPDTWTSADAAGLPMVPGLARYDEAGAGEIRHALRFTAPETRRAYVWPARHDATSLTDTRYPPMGQRFRLKAAFDITPFSPEVQVILRALKKYGMMLADNGSSWYLNGAPDERWDNDALLALDQVTGADFEAVDETSLMVDPNSGQARQPLAVHPQVSANDATGVIVIAASQALSVKISLPDGSLSGVNVDWWMVAIAPAGIYYYVYPTGWLAAPDLDHITPTQCALFDVAPVEVLNITGLGSGTYWFYFGVDNLMNGRVDYDALRYAVAEVRVE